MGTQELANNIRIHVLKMANRAGTSHVGSCLSCADVLAVLYGEIMQYKPQEPDWEGRNRFILSKGHAAAALYATLAEVGFFPVGELNNYGQPGSRLLGHASHKVPGVEASTGSLGHGLSIGCGMAIANPESKVFALLSDGDLNEGSTWEAIMFAGQRRLHNMIAIVDWNRLQAMGESAKILDMKILSRKAAEFGWTAIDVDGHNHNLLISALTDATEQVKGPCMIIAHTIKGKGVSWMEGDVRWHYRYPTDDELDRALAEIRKCY